MSKGNRGYILCALDTYRFHIAVHHLTGYLWFLVGFLPFQFYWKFPS